MAGRYAQNTTVSSQDSLAEIERTVTRYGASAFSYGWDQTTAIVGFKLRDRVIRFRIAMPDRDADEFKYTPARGFARTPKAAREEWEKACRQKWRALALVIKAKLEAVEAGVTSMEDEFLAATMLPHGGTVGEWAREQVDQAVRSGQMPSLLPSASAIK